jgi:3-oxoadipate enol-lactonase
VQQLFTTAKDGTRLAYRVDGEAAPGGAPRPVILVQHGLGFRGEAWGAWLPTLLGAGFRVIRPDWRGHGASGPMAAGKAWSTDQMLDDMEAVLDAQGVGPCHLLGESWGGTMSLALASRLGKRVRSLAVVSTAYDGTAIVNARNFARDIRAKGLAKWAAEVSVNRSHGNEALRAWSEDSTRNSDEGSMISICEYIVSETIEQRLAGIVAPTLIMAPFASHFVSMDLARMLSARVALNEIAWFPGHTHGLVLSGGALAANTLLNFIRRHTGEPS